MNILFGIILILKVLVAPSVRAAEIDMLNCGLDEAERVRIGKVDLTDYPWLGVLYYEYSADRGLNRAVTTVALIHAEFVLGPAADIGPMPKDDFTERTRVLIGHGWDRAGRRVRSYVIHPEYEESRHTVALVQLSDGVRTPKLRPICPPPKKLRDPEFFIMRFDDDYDVLQKEVILAEYVPSRLCKSFYEETKLYARSMRPPSVACAVSATHTRYCLWEHSGVLVTRDVWGRWQLLGLGLRGPGCMAPARYMDMVSYLPWVEQSLARYQFITVSRINQHKYALRRDNRYMQRFGDCLPEERKHVLYHDRLILKKYSLSNTFQTIQYNMTLKQAVRFSCLTMELIGGTSESSMEVRHTCPKAKKGGCYEYKESVFNLAVFIIFGDTCFFEVEAYGIPIQRHLIDKQVWKWEEGSYYPDFSLTRTEYRGTQQQTGFGFDPLDENMWVPSYDIWTTTPASNASTTASTEIPVKYATWEDEAKAAYDEFYKTAWVQMERTEFPQVTDPMFPGLETEPPPVTYPMPTTPRTSTTASPPSTPTTTSNTTTTTTTTQRTRRTKKTRRTWKRTTTTTAKRATTVTTRKTTPGTTTMGRWYG